jgi:SAM-dependent methyltransferase
MPADPRIYDSDRLARCYAAARPPVHQAICARLFAALPEGYRARAAIDVGCGAGASTAPLVVRAGHVLGIDPYLRMLRRARDRLPAATFVQGTAESLPVRAASIDLVTAAGSLNYTDLDRALGELARVLAPKGHLAVYDFSTGRVEPRDALSESSFRSFEQRFSWPAGYAIDLAQLPCDRHGLAFARHEAFVIDIAMSAGEYLDYIAGETNVEAAIAGGWTEPEARQACRAIFEPLFAREARMVSFACELALLQKGIGGAGGAPQG